MEKLIITAAICGAEVTKEQNPAVPYTLEEMVREAKSAYEAGAAILHIHVREDDGTPTQDRERFRVVMDAIRKELPDVIMIPSTGGATGMSPEERLQPTELFPEMATLDCGTCNFGDDVFMNDMPTMRAFGKQFNIVLGVSGCTPATAGNLQWLVNAIPAGSSWTATGIGRFAYELAAAAIPMGGNVRVGFEDTVYLSKGVLAKSNGELVARVVELANLLGRPVANPAEARKILSLG